NLTIGEAVKKGRIWDLSADVADTVQAGNPHADKLGNKEAWSFVRGPARTPGKGLGVIPTHSILGQWRMAAMDPARRANADKLAAHVQKILTGAQPAKEKTPERILFDTMVSPDGVLLKGLDLARFAKARPKEGTFGLSKDRFKDSSLIL